MLHEELKSQVDSGGRQVPLATDRSFVERLLRAYSERIEAPSSTGPLSAAPLTYHERRILILLANGVSKNAPHVDDRLAKSLSPIVSGYGRGRATS
jgi:hypothetical protein